MLNIDRVHDVIEGRHAAIGWQGMHLATIKKLQAELDKCPWISVSEGLPILDDKNFTPWTDDGTVDVYVIEHGQTFVANYYPKMGIWNQGFEPTFWMPIPTLPKEAPE